MLTALEHQMGTMISPASCLVSYQTIKFPINLATLFEFKTCWRDPLHCSPIHSGKLNKYFTNLRKFSHNFYYSDFLTIFIPLLNSCNKMIREAGHNALFVPVILVCSIVAVDILCQGWKSTRVFHFSSLQRNSQGDLAYIATIYSKTFAAKIRILGCYLNWSHHF